MCVALARSKRQLVKAFDLCNMIFQIRFIAMASANSADASPAAFIVIPSKCLGENDLQRIHHQHQQHHY